MGRRVDTELNVHFSHFSHKTKWFILDLFTNSWWCQFSFENVFRLPLLCHVKLPFYYVMFGATFREKSVFIPQDIHVLKHLRQLKGELLCTLTTCQTHTTNYLLTVIYRLCLLLWLFGQYLYSIPKFQTQFLHWI